MGHWHRQDRDAGDGCRGAPDYPRGSGKLLGAEVADAMRILYGGSVKPDNATALIGQEEIDGALVGGASLKPDSFTAIVKY